jgi:Putative restriction endonuclease
LEGVESTATNAVQTAQRLEALFREDGVRIKSLGRAVSAMRVFDALCERPVITLNEARRRAGASFPTATKGMDALLSLGIARELTGQRRNRVFAYQRYLDILNEGTDKELKEKMEEYIENGARLGWLIDPIQKKVYIYRPNSEVEELDNPASISGDPLLKDFILDLKNYFG